MTSKAALVTGIAAQDGACPAQPLLGVDPGHVAMKDTPIRESA